MQAIQVGHLATRTDSCYKTSNIITAVSSFRRSRDARAGACGMASFTFVLDRLIDLNFRCSRKVNSRNMEGLLPVRLNDIPQTRLAANFGRPDLTEEFVAAGDFLVYKFPVWHWHVTSALTF